ncbi:MAG TPA: PIN domain-containing protein [Solirubrobacterales bacterium]|nr:PIN domain-containing protein [Solirubrobacterales bacterium]
MDTGPMVAAMVADDAAHERCSPLLKPGPERRVLPAPVLVELDHLLGRELGPDAFPALLDTIRVGELDVEDLIASDYERAAELMRTYADLEVGFVDCAVLAVTERLGEPKLATLDHRHFGTMRPRHVEALELLPTNSGT